MKKERFLTGAATAGHQVEGNNANSDIWALEQMRYGGYPQKSGIAADHYHRYREDIDLLKQAGLNTYRFSLEWARIEPEKGRFSEKETEHYRDVIRYCLINEIEPVVTLFHFSSPKWLIEKGGWEAESTVEDFRSYTEYVCRAYRDLLHYVCTINEANLGVLIGIFIRQAMERAGKDNAVQIGLDIDRMAKTDEDKAAEEIQVFGHKDPAVFPSPRTPAGNRIIMAAHRASVRTIHEIIPCAKAGITLSLRDIQYTENGRQNAEKAWEEEFRQFLPALEDDDFFGLQNYTRTVMDETGELPPEEGKELTQMGYEYYPEGLEHVIRKVHNDWKKEILITENGIASDDDSRRISFIDTAMEGIRSCVRDGIDVKAYCYWSLMDNYEWQSGYDMRFGLMGIDRKTMERIPRESLYHLGRISRTIS